MGNDGLPKHDQELLLALAERLRAGLLLETPQGLVPLNECMRVWVDEYGVGPFHSEREETHLTLRSAQGVADFHLYKVKAPGASVVWVERDVRPFQNTGNPLFRVGADGRVQCVNHAGCDLVDYFGEELLGRLEAARVSSLAGADQTVELALGPRLFSFIVAEVEGADFLYLYGFDITEQRYTAAALRQSEARFRQLLEMAPDAVVITDGEGRIDLVNEQAEAMFGRTREALQGTSIRELFVEPVDALIHQADVGPVPERLYHGRRAQDEHFPVELRLRPLVREGAIALILILRDVTERERSAAEIRRLNAQLRGHVEALRLTNAELESFSYSVSHDLRSPLRTIGGFASIVLEDYGDRLDEEGQGYLRKVSEASRFMAGLIDDLLRLSRIQREPLRIEPVDLSRLAAEVAQRLQEQEPSRQVQWQLAAQVGAEGDRNLLRVVLENLLGNAWKYSARKTEARIEFGVSEESGETVYFVRDNGAGFSMADRHLLFQPFQRLHTGSEFAGHGIGLATVQRIIRRHGGRIWAEAREGEGATFFFTLDPGSAPTEQVE